MNSKKGITLIALVITIIVLLILAGVSISAITGENGIVQKAKEAKDATRVSQIKEQIELYKAEKAMLETGESGQTINEFIDELETNGTITSEEKAEILEKHTLTIGNQEPVVFPFGKTLVQAFKDGELKVGDYVSYTPSDLDATVEIGANRTGYEYETYSVDTTMNWRVLGLNEDETELLIISGSPVKSNGERGPYLELESSAGYWNGIEILNEISSIYHNEKFASEARSVTIEDINNALGIVVENNMVYKKSDTSKTNIDVYETMGQTYTYQSGDYAPEKKKVGDTVDITAYAYRYYDESIVDSESVLYDMLFDENTEEEEYSKAYWLASSGVYLYSDGSRCSFGIGNVKYGVVTNSEMLFHSSGYWYRERAAVRPVVSLKSDVTIEDVPLTTGNEDDWNIDNYEEDFWESGNLNYGKVEEIDS